MTFILILILISFQLTNCQTNDSFIFKQLYQKFRTESKSSVELNAIQSLFEINQRIVSFESNDVFKIVLNGTKLDQKSFDRVLYELVKSSLKSILGFVNITKIFNGHTKTMSTGISCMACHSLINLLFNTIIPLRLVKEVFVGFCSTGLIPSLSKNVCQGFTNMIQEHLEYIRHNTKLKRSEICGQLLGVQCYIISGTCFDNPRPYSEKLCWKLQLNQNKSVKRKPVLSEKRKTYRILQLSDIHIDPEYVPLDNTDCGQPYCCRVDMLKNSTSNVSPSAGYWGSYYCDSPVHLVENLFETIDWQTIDLVYWLGDVTPHDSWNDNWNRTIISSRIISELFKKYSKSLVVGAVGNHMPVPVGFITPPEINNGLSSKPVFKELAEEWSQWLDSEAYDSFLRAGYYTVKIRPGFRIIVVNTNYCTRLNIWTHYQGIDPANQLKWLAQQLDEAEKVGDLVHIVGHIAPDNRECTQSWLYNYMAIVERYKDTIVGQFYGHTHMDEFKLYHSNTDCNKPIGFAILCPSVTPFSEHNKINPSYRVITIDDHGLILEVETFKSDLSLANSVVGSKPKWFLEYSMTTDYEISLDTNGFNQLYSKLIGDNIFIQLFYSHYLRISSQTNDMCGTDCQTNILNDINVCNAFDSIPKSILSVG